MVDGGREGGRRVKYGRPHQIFIFAEEKYEFVYSQLCIWGLPALDDDFSKIYRHISAIKPGIINDRLIVGIFLEEGEGGRSLKNKHMDISIY